MADSRRGCCCCISGEVGCCGCRSQARCSRRACCLRLERLLPAACVGACCCGCLLLLLSWRLAMLWVWKIAAGLQLQGEKLKKTKNQRNQEGIERKRGRVFFTFLVLGRPLRGVGSEKERACSFFVFVFNELKLVLDDLMILIHRSSKF